METKQKLTTTLYKTITDINLWQDVLREMCNITGARQGIIMLRDKKSADMYITQNAHLDLKTPLVYGLSSSEIESYITQYQACDPWTEIELKNHPYRPYAISSFFPITALKQTEFWTWLAPQNVSDSVVVDIFNAPEHWVSINLHFDGENEKLKTNCLQLLSDYHGLMNDIWQLGQQFRASHASPAGVDYFLAQQKQPAFLVDNKTQVINQNKQALKLITQDSCLLSIKDNRLFFKSNDLRAQLRRQVEQLRENKYCPENPPSCSFNMEDLTFHCTLIGQGEDTIGFDTALRLVSVEPFNALSNETISPIWETPCLTKRERELVTLLANGGRVVDFMSKYGIAKSTAHAHWGKVKDKLEIKDRSEIFAHHQLFLESSN